MKTPVKTLLAKHWLDDREAHELLMALCDLPMMPEQFVEIANEHKLPFSLSFMLERDHSNGVTLEGLRSVSLFPLSISLPCLRSGLGSGVFKEIQPRQQVRVIKAWLESGRDRSARINLLRPVIVEWDDQNGTETMETILPKRGIRFDGPSFKPADIQCLANIINGTEQPETSTAEVETPRQQPQEERDDSRILLAARDDCGRGLDTKVLTEPSLLFQAYDPYLSFSEDSPGYEQGVFREDESTRREWHDSHAQQVIPIWHEGRVAYTAVALALGKQPTAQDFKALIMAVDELGRVFAPLVREAVDVGYLVLEDELGDKWLPSEGLNSMQALEAVVAIHLRQVEEGSKAETPACIEMNDGVPIELETLFYALAVTAIDDCLIAYLLSNGEMAATLDFKRYLHTAETIIRTKRVASAVKSEQGREGAKARAEKYYNRDGAIKEWDATGHSYSSAAAFARQRHKDFNYTDPEHLARIIRKDGKKHPKKLK